MVEGKLGRRTGATGGKQKDGGSAHAASAGSHPSEVGIVSGHRRDWRDIPWLNLVALVAFFSFCGVLDLLLIRAWRDTYALQERGVGTTAVVTHVWGRSRRRGYAFSYEYRVNDRSFEAEAVTNRPLTEGQRIEVVYLEEHPSVVMLRSGMSRAAVWTFGVGLLAFNCFVWGAFVWLLWPHRHS